MGGIPGSSNGFFEKAALLAVITVTLFCTQLSDNGWLTLWCGVLGLVALYLAWEFNIFSFTPDDWAQNEVREWSQSTLGEAPSDYIQAVSDVRERFVPSHGTLWWFFRMVYVALGLALLAVAAEREFWGTNQSAAKLLQVISYL